MLNFNQLNMITFCKNVYFHIIYVILFSRLFILKSDFVWSYTPLKYRTTIS